MDADACQVNAAIEAALRASADAYEARGILVIRHLEATLRLQTEEPVLMQALTTIFRGLPERLAPAATLLIRTRDRAGGDIELVWEAREAPYQQAPGATRQEPLARGPYGDLLELAVAGLQEFCRVRTGYREQEDPAMDAGSTFLTLAPHVRRRYLFLIPSLDRSATRLARR
jgi:hypothetical protein